MNVLLFGATGMVGQGALRECLLADDVSRVLAVGRTETGQSHPKLQELLHGDLFEYSSVEAQLTGFDACFFCIGVTSSGMDEAQYTRLTYELTLAAATTLARLNPHMTFVYVSGAGADSSEQGKTMWARVRGRTENALRRLPFKAVYILRLGIIQPLHGIRSKTGSYRVFYALSGFLLPLLRVLMPNVVLSTEIVGRAMLNLVRHGASKTVLEAADISPAGRSTTG
ncbi:NAD(P)H-binding protein [Rhodanobacter sp. L36]|uniref:NAD(P)H-binding protein n=1 Tax=Rhodanobacter sp. L36 TaxID=1747221 RepID=UPI00131DA771|nr:NAD(P)H-binding protein [Rhodanobacter sp. L36]